MRIRGSGGISRDRKGIAVNKKTSRPPQLSLNDSGRALTDSAFQRRTTEFLPEADREAGGRRELMDPALQLVPES
jgi:hypothetical protein